MSCPLAKAFQELRDSHCVDARHYFGCCDSCGSSELCLLEDPSDDTIGYCFYHEQYAVDIGRRRSLALSYAGFITPTNDYIAEEVGEVICACLQEHGFHVMWDGEGDQKINVDLDNASVEFVRALGDGFPNGVRKSYEWKFFDFDLHWDAFAELWYGPEVQTILRASVERHKDLWETEAYWRSASDQKWEPGDALWHLTDDTLSVQRIWDRFCHSNNTIYRNYAQTFKTHCPALCMSEDAFYDSELGLRCVAQAARQERSLASLIVTLIDTVDFPIEKDDSFVCHLHVDFNRCLLRDALLEVATKLFGDANVVEGPEDSEVVVVLDNGLVFDPVGFYFFTKQAWDGMNVEDVAEIFHLDACRAVQETEVTIL